MVEVETIRAYLEAAPGPAALKTIQKDLRAREGWGADRVNSSLEEAERSGTVFQWPRYRRSDRYWHRDPASVVRERALAVAAEAALPKKDLVARTVESCHNCGRKAAQQAIAALEKEGRLKVAKTVGQTGLYFTPENPSALVGPSMAMLRGRLRQFGVDDGIPAETARPHSDRILEEIRRIQPSPGVPVTVQSVRAAADGLPKPNFDAAVLSLADQRKVYLTTHDHGWSLPEVEREQLVWDGGQKLYVAVTLRD